MIHLQFVHLNIMNTQKQLVGFSETGYFSTVFIDYINGSKKLQPFYKYTPELASFKKVIADIQKHSFNRKLLVEVIKQQYSSLQLPASSLQLLLNENTFTVCTGHQLCLFTGPLYFIYKIITTINLAEELKKEYSEYNFVPVYWMASEDHDFDEINHIHLFGKKIEWNKETAVGNRQIAVGKLKTDSIKSVVDELKPVLGESASTQKLIELFSNAYLKNDNLADATRYLVNELFGEYGLLIIDANDERLKKEFIHVIKDDIFNNTNYKITDSAIQQLDKSGYKAQVNPREINVFYMTDSFRERITMSPFEGGDRRSGDVYKVLNTDITFTKEQLEKEIETHPERFSPNVVLRPMYQQTILPNLAYVGGPAEIAYWLEYQAMFDHHKIHFPVLIPRNSVLWIDENTRQQIEKLGLNTKDLFKPVDILIKDSLNKYSTGQISLNEEEEKLKTLYKDIVTKAEKIDSTLKPAVEAELQKHLNALKNIESKIVRSEKQKHENVLNKVKKLKEKLFPDNKLQERYENFIPFYLKYGKGFIKALKSNLKPFENTFMVCLQEAE